MTQDKAVGPRIIVAGVGGAGVNATALIQDESAPGLETVAIDTDGQTLVTAQPRVRIELGDGTGGAGGDPAVGAAAAEAAVEQLRSTFSWADVVFVLAGLGGGTGSGAAPVCAQAARDGGALVFGIAIRPFRFEGPRRATYADEAARAWASRPTPRWSWRTTSCCSSGRRRR